MNFENCKGYMTCPELLNMIVEVYNTGVDPGHMDQKSSGQDTWFHICLLVHVPRANPRMGHLFNRIQQLKAWHVAIRILKIHPQTAEIWQETTFMVTIVLLFASVTMLSPDPTLLNFWENLRQIRSSLGITRTKMSEDLQKMGKFDFVGTLLCHIDTCLAVIN